MITLADLEVPQLETHLRTGGFLAAFTDIFDVAQPAPAFQAYEVDLTCVQPDQRVVMIRETGGVNNPQTRVLFKMRNMTISVFSKSGQTDSIVTKGLAEAMEQWLVANPFDDGCLNNIVSSGVSGPYTTEDSRRVYEIRLAVTFAINQPQFN